MLSMDPSQLNIPGIPNIPGMPGMPNIMEMAQNMANSMSEEEKHQLANMDMEGMVNQVTKTVMGNFMNPEGDLKFEMPTMDVPSNPPQGKSRVCLEDSEEESETELAPRTKDIHYTLSVTLKELYAGTEKLLKITRKRIKTDEVTGKKKPKKEKKRIEIPIEPGMMDEQVIRLNKEANEKLGYETGDIVITLCEKQHEYFSRDGSDLYLSKNISLSEAYACEFEIEHLDGRKLKVKNKDNDALHLYDGYRKIEGEGMPKLKSFDRGDLFIRFNLILPDVLPNKEGFDLSEFFPALNSISKDETEYVKCILKTVTEDDLDKIEGDSYTDDEEEDTDFDSDCFDEENEEVEEEDSEDEET
jgi:DnaJ-class molecular chaperone